MALCLWVAIIVEAGVGHYEDVGILAAIQAFNAGLAFHEASKAADAVAALKSGLKPRATAKRDGAWATVDAAGLVPGDLVKLVSGAAVPADVRVRTGQVDVDASSLTGESLPVSTGPGEDARMGSTVVRGEAEAVVSATGGHTFFGRTAALLGRGAGGPDNISRVITRITAVLSLLALALCGTVLAYLLARGGDVRSVLGFVVVLLVSGWEGCVCMGGWLDARLPARSGPHLTPPQTHSTKRSRPSPSPSRSWRRPPWPWVPGNWRRTARSSPAWPPWRSWRG
jgi:H+-transporting ATPase